jgi:hypothetical protein
MPKQASAQAIDEGGSVLLKSVARKLSCFPTTAVSSRSRHAALFEDCDHQPQGNETKYTALACMPCIRTRRAVTRTTGWASAGAGARHLISSSPNQSSVPKLLGFCCP